MTDAPVIEKKLALIETCVGDLLAFVRAIRARLQV